jgi:hypothetical protein
MSYEEEDTCHVRCTCAESEEHLRQLYIVAYVCARARARVLVLISYPASNRLLRGRADKVHAKALVAGFD